MRVSIIVAMDRNNLIGASNQIPWHIPGELKRFREITMGKPIIMGRKTHQSIGKPLDGRENIVLTKNEEINLEGVKCYSNLNDIFSSFRNEKEVFVIGGSQIYEITLPIANRLYITMIDREYLGDTWFPKVDYSKWKTIERNKIIEKTTQTEYSNIIYDRISE
tara:strand:+ start:275 stop:763 length:489 start_codon:yes stop_codon:yes gene_type:complete